MDESAGGYQDFGYVGARPLCSHRYVLPGVLELMGPISAGVRVLDVGCGNGALAGELMERSCKVVGIDLSEQGIAEARRAYPGARFEVLAADDQLLQRLDEAPFDFVVSTEVVEHLYDPKSFIRGCVAALKPGGRLICSTPYHGYLKNLAIAFAGKWDSHANPLWDGGHIKLWSRQTLSSLYAEAGLTDLQFRGVGRFPWMWMSMILSGNKAGR